MGQKVHPLGFRVGITQNYKSKWFIKPNYYSSLLFQDYIIRENILKYFDIVNKSTTKNKKSFVDSINITDINITRKFDKIDISIDVVSINNHFFDDSMFNTRNIIDKLQKILVKQLSFISKNNLSILKIPNIVINIKEVTNVNTNAVFISKCLIDDLENRIPFRRALKNILDNVQKQKELLGIKIKISGRLNGIEMARSEWVREGRIPLHTMTANIEYYNDVAHTKYGLLGVKVWVYKKDLNS